jgi:cyclopropane fatty-acyl-phospholipid synthase-like methyltransferase
MERQIWLEERQAAVLASYDEEARTYDQNEYPTTSHPLFVARLLETCPPGGILLDAACGTGKYFDMISAAGRRVVGIDQSGAMLAQARAREIAFSLAQMRMQEIAVVGEFDAIMSVDAMENVGPDDWPLVLANLHRALRPGGHLYLTVEEIDEAEIDRAFLKLAALGVPAVRGEVIEGDVAGYHYYPGRERVKGWINAEGLDIVEEAFDQEDGWGYRHLLLRSR